MPVVVERGAQWWTDQGVGDSVGWKFFAVSGHVERPGVYSVPMGTTARSLLDLAGGVAGGAALHAIQPGGASSNFLGPDLGRCAGFHRRGRRLARGGVLPRPRRQAGQPTLLATCAGVPLIGLPGNPLSALVVFRLFGAPLAGEQPARRGVELADVPETELAQE